MTFTVVQRNRFFISTLNEICPILQQFSIQQWVCLISLYICTL